jgi:hypothetical protein
VLAIFVCQRSAGFEEVSKQKERELEKEKEKETERKREREREDAIFL